MAAVPVDRRSVSQKQGGNRQQQEYISIEERKKEKVGSNVTGWPLKALI